MDFGIEVDMMVIIVSICIIVVATMAGAAIHAYFNIKREELKIMMQTPPKNPKDELEYSKEMLSYSREVLEFIRSIVAQEAVIYFRNFVGGHHIEKVTLAQVKNIVNDVATRVKESITITNIDFSKTIYNRSFYNHFVVESCSNYIKQLLEKYVIEVVE